MIWPLKVFYLQDIERIIWEDDVQQTDSIILSAGGKEQLLSDFNALKEAQTMSGEAKYGLRPTLENVAKIICAQSSGPNKDLALFELSHFYLGLIRLKGSELALEILLSPEKPSNAYFKDLLKDLGDDFAKVDNAGLNINVGGKTFLIKYSRMSTLTALFDFLCAMDNFAHFQNIQNALNALGQDKPNGKLIQTCTNALGSILRKYRIKTLAFQEADGRFLQVLKFLKERSPDHNILIQDDDILDFWQLHNTGKDYKGYRTVFDLFCDFSRALEQTQNLKDAVHAAPMGLDHESGEIDFSDQDVSEFCDLEIWQNPFDGFDEEELSDIRFFKKASERKPLENLMRYGPDALDFPMAFLRYDLFGQIQSGITNDLQVGRDKQTLRDRVNCENISNYEEHLGVFNSFEQHVKTLQAACLFIISNLPPDSETGQMAKQAINKLKRKGFEEDAEPEPFEIAAPLLVQFSTQVQNYLSKLDQSSLGDQFEKDKTTFSNQFHHLYEKVLS